MLILSKLKIHPNLKLLNVFESPSFRLLFATFQAMVEMRSSSIIPSSFAAVSLSFHGGHASPSTNRAMSSKVGFINISFVPVYQES